MRLPTLALLLLPAVASADPVDFARQVQPLLKTHCVSCHGTAKQKAGLKLELGSQVLKGGVNGPVVVAKKSADSRLVQALNGTHDLARMPPTAALPAADVALIARWIDEGATVPANEKDAAPTHWAFVPPKQATVPDGVHPVDHFLREQWKAKGLTPAGEADRTTLARRLYLDLVGLPPTPAELDAFTADPAPTAYEKLVDKLLADPRYGERWGRHLLDVWRYSDWYGFGGELRNSQKHVWRWRDWVVESLNANVSYDRMIADMLAADELHPADANAVRATGYLARSYYKFNRNVWLDDIVEHTGKAFLGVTLNCARCHDHMYDPISQEDYYRFRAVFEPHQIRLDVVPGETDAEKAGTARVYDADLKVQTFLFERGNDKNPKKDKPLPPGVPAGIGPGGYAAKEVPLPASVTRQSLNDTFRKNLITAAEKQLEQAKAAKQGARATAAEKNLAAVRAKLDAESARHSKPPAANAPDLVKAAVKLQLEAAELAAAADVADAEAALKKLEAAEKKDAKAVEAAAKKVTEAKAKADAAKKAAEKPPADYAPLGAVYPDVSSGRRSALAAWTTAKENPLTPRVFVNHVWLRHFGQPIVPTVFDFGKNGRPPTHPALLDWLAVEFVKGGWDVKKLHRLMLTSAAYRMSSSLTGPAADANRKADPDNLLVWKMNPRPLEAEAIRDSLLSVSGLLDPTAGGPELDHNDDAPKPRRSIYYRHAPEKQMPFLTTLDGPSPTECYRRATTVVPQQAMALANSKLSARAADAAAKVLAAKEPAGIVGEAFRLVLNRPPTADESRLCVEFLKTNTQAALVQVLFNHADFSTIR